MLYVVTYNEHPKKTSATQYLVSIGRLNFHAKLEDVVMLYIGLYITYITYFEHGWL